MYYNSYKSPYSLSNDQWLKKIGEYVKHQRLSQNKTQDAVSKAAGISRSTLSLLERGETVTTTTLLQVLREINALEILEAFKITKELSPMAIAKAQQKERQRASSNNTVEEPEGNWEW